MPVKSKLTAEYLTGLPPSKITFVIEYVKDFSPRRAAEAAGFAADHGYQLIKQDKVNDAIQKILQQRLEASDIDAEWLLMEAVDNHAIARQLGNLNASNTALNLVGKHVFVDAFAAEKVEVNSSEEVMARLMRGRKRVNEMEPDEDTTDQEVSFL